MKPFEIPSSRKECPLRMLKQRQQRFTMLSTSLVRLVDILTRVKGEVNNLLIQTYRMPLGYVWLMKIHLPFNTDLIFSRYTGIYTRKRDIER